MKKAKKKVKRAPAKKQQLPTRVPTGITNFDKLIEGGFERKSTNLITGGSGRGKSIFATQFLMEGLKRDENCLYITFEENKEEFYTNMRRFGWDLAAYEGKEKFVFLEYTPEKVRTMLEEGGGAIETIILKKKISRVVLDSITSFALLFDDELAKKEASLSLFNMIRKWNCTALLTLEGDSSADLKAGAHTVEFESDSIIALYFPRGKNERERYIEILKMRGTEHSKKIFPFAIGKKGIAVGTKPYSGKIDFS